MSIAVQQNTNQPNERAAKVDIADVTRDSILQKCEPTEPLSYQSEQLVGNGDEGVLIHAEAKDALEHLATARPKIIEDGAQLIYLDPPYNTGESFVHYSDNRKSSVWLDDLRSNLVLAKQLLANSGSLWLHLDDNEQHRARCILDEVFGEDAFVATIIWQKRLTRENRKAFSSMHDYIHVYSPAGAKAWKHVRNGLPDPGAFNNPDNDPRGPWRSVPMNVQAGHATASQFYTVVTPTGARHEPPPGRCWTYTQERLQELDGQGRVYWPRSGHGKPRLKRYIDESSGLTPFTIWSAQEVGDTSTAKKELMRECSHEAPFATPKPLGLLERVIQVATSPGDTVIDFYLGSGTTAVAAQLTGRKWIGIERSRRTIDEYAIPRVKNAWQRQQIGGIVLSHIQ